MSAINIVVPFVAKLMRAAFWGLVLNKAQIISPSTIMILNSTISHEICIQLYRAYPKGKVKRLMQTKITKLRTLLCLIFSKWRSERPIADSIIIVNKIDIINLARSTFIRQSFS